MESSTIAERQGVNALPAPWRSAIYKGFLWQQARASAKTSCSRLSPRRWALRRSLQARSSERSERSENAGAQRLQAPAAVGAAFSRQPPAQHLDFFRRQSLRYLTIGGILVERLEGFCWGSAQASKQNRAK